MSDIFGRIGSPNAQIPSPSNYETWGEWARELVQVLTISGGYRVGAIADFMGDVPEGWLECNGEIIDKRSYPQLVQLLGGWGAGEAALPVVAPRGPGMVACIKA